MTETLLPQLIIVETNIVDIPTSESFEE